MTELLQRPLTEVRELLERRKISAVELMRATLARIDAANPALNAFVALRERDALLADAAAADARLARGEARPLEGIPLGVKDLENAAGLVTSEGSVPFKDNLAECDSVQVSRLRGAGAIVVGKTNAPEFGYTAITKNLLFGVTRNPWNLERSPGGSSGGSSAAIAGGLIPLATASDGGGSVRLPASMTGCFGLKPSYGRIPHECQGLVEHGRHRGARAAHAQRRGRRASSRRHRGSAPAGSQFAPAPGLLLSRNPRPSCPRACASAGRRTSATPWCSATSARSRTMRRASSKAWATASRKRRRGFPSSDHDWGLLQRLRDARHGSRRCCPSTSTSSAAPSCAAPRPGAG